MSLAVNIRNNQMQPVRVNQLKASFMTHPQIAPAVMSLSLPLIIAPSELAGISFEASNNIIIPEPAPGEITISLSCVDFDEPATKSVPLRPYQSPVSGGSYSFPAKVGDLRNGEYWLGGSASHASGSGTQLFGYDLGVWAFDTALPVPGWSYLLPGTRTARGTNISSHGNLFTPWQTAW